MDNEILNRLQNIVSKTAKLTEYFQNCQSNTNTKSDFDTLAEDYFIGNKRRYANELNEFLNANM